MFQRNKRNRVEFVEVATGKVIEVNSATAYEIQKAQQALIAQGKAPEYELNTTPDVQGFEETMRKIANQEIAKYLGSAGVVSADGQQKTHPATKPSNADDNSLEEVMAAIAHIQESADDYPEGFTDSGNPKKATIEQYLGSPVDNSVYQKAIRA